MGWTIKHEYHRHNWRQYELKSMSNKPSYKWIKALFRSDVIIIYAYMETTNKPIRIDSLQAGPSSLAKQTRPTKGSKRIGTCIAAPMSINQNRGPTLIAKWKYNDMNVINYSTAPSCFWQLFRPGPLAFINNSPMTGEGATTITKNVFPLVTNLIPRDKLSYDPKIMLKTPPN